MRRNQQKSQRRAMNLLELMISVVIIGILAGLSIPRFGKLIESSRQSEAINIMMRMYKGYKELTTIERLMVFGDDSMQDVKGCTGPNQFTFALGIQGNQGWIDCSFFYLGFDESLNENTRPYFTYFYYGNNTPCTQDDCNANVPVAPAKFCAIRKAQDNTAPNNNNGLDFNRYVCMACINGTLYKSYDYR